MLQHFWVDDYTSTSISGEYSPFYVPLIVFRFSEPEANSPHPAGLALDVHQKCSTIDFARAMLIFDCL